ncbi:Nramp family divalent metal transporter [Candidatus Magnetobacterium casense]|uniref:Nramp family divalent metal transporter n=1 Tax=Candidatus Magnetobacterium casense TaxID=1455061 RepID=A0ABS6RWK0_9BACT|nr:Nramp family divalent metal transporter [Candidatus Magnetobacterium casensis]MBV6341011.1 Nramp family divalent metal transporter [Candidatus Magnetobacterium casensis]
MTNRWRNFIILLSIVGPGIITANVDNDAGGITTYSLAGAHFGYSLLWSLIPITIALIVVQEMSSRMGVITGKGLAELIRENYGVKITFWLMLALSVTNIGNTAAEFAGWAASNELFGISKYISVPVGALIVWLLVVKGTYQVVEKIFLAVCVVYLVYIPAAFMAKPQWSQVATEMLRPSFSFDTTYIVMLIGMVGTTIAPWMQFYLQSSVVEKGIKKETYWASRIDVVFGCFMVDIIALFIIVTCGATLFKAGVHVETAKDVAIALQPMAGRYASILFGIGLANASLFSASILPLATAYTICEGMGFEAGVNKSFRDAPIFMTLYTVFIVIGAMIVLVPTIPLIAVMWMSQVVNGVMLPFVLVFMLMLINKKDLMGDYVNGRAFNWIAWGTTITMVALTVLFVLSMFFW